MRFPTQLAATNMQLRAGRLILSLFTASLLGMLILTACSTTNSKAVPSSPPMTPMAAKLKIESDQRILCSVAGQLENTRSALVSLDQNGGWHQRGYFTSEENNRMERLYFRFVVSQNTLWDIIDSYRGLEDHFTDDETAIKAHVLVLYAELLRAYHTSFMVAEVMDDPVAIAKLNEAFFASEIPQGTYDRLRRNVTSKDNANMLAAAWILYAEDLSDPQSMVAELGKKDPVYAKLLEQLPDLYSGAMQQTQRILKAHSGTENYFSHTRAAKLAREATQEFGKLRYAIRALLFKNVSRLKSPTVHLIRFSDTQKKEVYDLLQPGDLILTYTAGYISDIFIPGMFKHGITYVGSPVQRADAGLNARSLPGMADPERNRFDHHIVQKMLPGNEAADIIEAVAEGVIFNNLAKIMDTHINRLLVLRPIISGEERTQFLASVFSYLGEEYDFYFDFADSSRLVCTEVHYRALTGKGGIDFTLTKRGGHETLSADDIVHYYFETRPRQFKIILFADEDPKGAHHQARLLLGGEAERHLKALMAAARPGDK